MPLFVRQYLVAGSSLLAALAVGCSVGYPSVLLQQLSSNDTTIQLDWDTASWIGSIHGIAGIPSLIMPIFIQWQGRRLGFILACLISIIGWILTYTATSPTFLLISESFNGFGNQCISAANGLAVSEMLSPQVRKMSMGLYLVVETFGMALVQFLGSYFHWKTVSVIVSAPLIVSALTACTWPESPSWLAYKGEFSKSAKAFKRLRGADDVAQSELEELILAQKENRSQVNKSNKLPLLKSVWQTMRRRDFYLPNVHIFIALLSVYWSGPVAHLIYAADIIEHATNSKDAVFFGSTTFNCSLFICSFIGTILIKYTEPKKVILGSVTFAVVGLLCAAGVNFSQTIGWIPKESYLCLYLLIAYMFSISLIIPIMMPISAELTPVKYRGIAGPLQVIFPCVLHTTSLKSVPYMLKYINLWGMLLVFAAIAILCTLYTWKYIPETKGRTLQQLEDYYNYGNFEKCRSANIQKSLVELLPVSC